ncbi:MAG: hypothetical protein WC670_07500 [Pseudolabrys sp.]|jgi:hypothetical protein
MVKLVRDVMLAIFAVAAFCAALASIVGASPAAAQATPRDVLRQACGDDVRRLCPGVMPGGGRIQKCFAEKQDQVSPGCKSAMQDARAMNGNAKANGTGTK